MKKEKRKQKIIFWLFLAPALIAFLMVQIIPFFIGLYYSFTNWSATAQASIDWVGLENYKAIAGDTQFLYSTIITTVYTVLNIISVNVIAFALALLVTSKIKGKNIYRAGFFLPNIIGGIILGYLWQFIFGQLVVQLAHKIGIEALQTSLLRSPNGALIALVIVGTWQYAGYIMMIYVAALQNVPKDLIEAAEIDGATAWQRFRHITIPMVRPAITVSVFLTLVNSFKQFDVNVSLVGVGPARVFMDKIVNGTSLLALNIYNTSTVALNTALAQAKAVLFFLVLVVFSLLQVYFSKKKEIEL